MGLLNKPDLVQYIYRKLGHPVIRVELAEEQLEDCIDEAIKTYTEQHLDACEIGYINHQVVKDQSEYTLSETVQDVLDVLNIEGQNSSLFPWADEPLLLPYPYIGWGYNVGYCGYYDAVDVEVHRQRYQLWEDTIRHPVPFEFNQVTKKLYFPDAPDSDGVRVLKIWQTATDITGEAVQDSLWLKKYVVALAKYQWGHNISKYTGAQLPGGVELNGERIMGDAKEEIEKLETELEEKYSEPPDPVFA